MSGHSKWATIKHKKGAADKARGKLFARLLRQVEVAAREGGGDINSNATLRTAVQKAKDSSVPSDTIERAIKRGTGELEGVTYESLTFEGYGPAGVAVYIEVLTDNRNRTGPELRNIFSKNGGSPAEPGAVSWQFERKGLIVVPDSVTEDDLMLVTVEAGAEDIVSTGEFWEVRTGPSDLMDVRAALERADIAFESAEVTMISQNIVEIGDEAEARKILKLMDLIEDHDDVQNVYSNFDISESIMESLD